MTTVEPSPRRRTWSQWSCSVAVTVGDARDADRAATLVSDLMTEVDLAASRFRGDSELAVCNARAGRATLVSPLFRDLLAAGLQAASDTDGLVDPTVATHLEAAGYDRDITELSDVSPAGTDQTSPPVITVRPAARRLPNWRAVRLDAELGMVVVPSGLGLDLGATAKAWTADRAAALVADHCRGPVLVEIGGDLAVATAESDPFVIRVAERQGAEGELVTVAYGGLATSTATVRRWGHGDRQAHHIIDPRTGSPADVVWRTASVWAPSALEANVASTASIVMGATAPSWLDQQSLPARLVGQDGGVAHVGAWPTEREAA